MNKNKLFSSFFVLVNIFFIFVTVIHAETIPCPLPAELCDFRSALSTLSSLILPVAGLVLLLILIYAGFTKLTAAGDAEKEKKAMQIIQAAIIGFAIIALAGVIVATIGSFFGVQLLLNNP